MKRKATLVLAAVYVIVCLFSIKASGQNNGKTFKPQCDAPYVFVDQ